MRRRRYWSALACLESCLSAGAIAAETRSTLGDEASDVLGEVLSEAGLGTDDIDWVVPHQANARILDATAKKLNLASEKVVVTVDRHANTSAASVPLALDAAVRDDFSLTNAVIAVSTLFLMVFLTSALAHRFSGFERAIGGTPSVLAHNGKFVLETMNHERVSPDEIYSELRKVGLLELKQVRWVLLEPDGKIAVIPRPQESHTGKAPEKEPA